MLLRQSSRFFYWTETPAGLRSSSPDSTGVSLPRSSFLASLLVSFSGKSIEVFYQGASSSKAAGRKFRIEIDLFCKSFIGQFY